MLELTHLALTLAAACAVPQTPTVRDEVDIIELNHVYDGDGQLVLRQLIFWEWRPQAARHHVVAWRLWKVGEPRPLRDWPRGGYTLLFHDGQILRCVRAEVFRETWTQFDREISDRRRLSQDGRRGLSSVDSPRAASGHSHSHR